MNGWRPGDRLPDAAAMLRVNQAGEYGATRIYAGQMAVLRRSKPAAKLVALMAGQEERHLEHFNRMMADRGVRPTLLQPVWNVAGFALGAATALISEEAAMACTEAVETEIDLHYGRQLEELGSKDPELSSTIEKFRQDELEHRDVAREAGAALAPGYPLLTATVRAACRMAITLSKRI